MVRLLSREASPSLVILASCLADFSRTVTIKLNRPRSVSQGIITARLPRPTPSDASQKFDNIQHQIANASFVGIIDKLSEPGLVNLASFLSTIRC